MINTLLKLLTYGPGWSDAALALLRFGVGSFFAISGYNKLTVKSRHAALVRTFKQDKIPFISFMQWWVPSWEMVGGAFVALGFLTIFHALVLCIICFVACDSEASARVDAFGPINKGDRFADYLYLPEVLYMFMLGVSVMAGAGRYSIDALIF